MYAALVLRSNLRRRSICGASQSESRLDSSDCGGGQIRDSIRPRTFTLRQPFTTPSPSLNPLPLSRKHLSHTTILNNTAAMADEQFDRSEDAKQEFTTSFATVQSTTKGPLLIVRQERGSSCADLREHA